MLLWVHLPSISVVQQTVATAVSTDMIGNIHIQSCKDGIYRTTLAGIKSQLFINAAT